MYRQCMFIVIQHLMFLLALNDAHQRFLYPFAVKLEGVTWVSLIG